MTIRRADGVVWRSAPEYLVLSDLDGRITEIGGSGVDVWEQLDEAREQGELVARLAAAHQVDVAVVGNDIAPLIDELVARQLLVRDG